MKTQEMAPQEQTYEEVYEKVKQQFQGVNSFELVHKAKGGDNDAFNELVRRYIRNIEGVYIGNQDNNPHHEFAARQVRLTAFNECINNPSLLEEEAEKEGLDVNKDEDLGAVFTAAIQQLTPALYTQLIDYRLLPQDILSEKASKGDPLASYILSEIAADNSPTVERIVCRSSDPLVIGNRIFTEDYVDVYKVGNTVVRQVCGTQLLAKYREVLKTTGDAPLTIGKLLF
jgi:hypothetical protein